MCHITAAFIEPPNDLPRFVKIADAAESMDVSPQTIRGWLRRGELPHFRIANTIRIPRTAVEALATAASRDASAILDKEAHTITNEGDQD